MRAGRFSASAIGVRAGLPPRSRSVSYVARKRNRGLDQR